MALHLSEVIGCIHSSYNASIAPYYCLFGFGRRNPLANESKLSSKAEVKLFCSEPIDACFSYSKHQGNCKKEK